MNFEDILNKKHVRSHPLIAGARQQQRRTRETLQRYAADLETEDSANKPDLNDIFSQAASNTEPNDKGVESFVRASIRAASDALAQFDFPLLPQLSFQRVRDAKYSSVNSRDLISGLVVLSCRIPTVTGALRQAEIPVSIVNGNVVPPSIIIHDGTMSVLAQSAVDAIVQRATSYELSQPRGMFSPPLSKVEREVAFAYRNELGWQPREFNRPGMSNTRHSHKQAAEKGVPRAYALVVEDMQKAKDDGTDTFPHIYSYLEHNYILKRIPTCDKDKWEVPLINDGWAVNPWARNRRRGSKQGQFDSPAISSRAEQVADTLFGYLVEDGDSLEDAANRIGTQFPELSPFDLAMGLDLYNRNISRRQDKGIRKDTDHLRLISDSEMADYFGYDPRITPASELEGYTEEREAKQAQAQAEAEEDYNLIEPKTYSGTRMPIEVDDTVKFEGTDGAIRGVVTEIGDGEDWVIVRAKGIEYRVHAEDIQPLNNTYKKKWAAKWDVLSDLINDVDEILSMDRRGLLQMIEELGLAVDFEGTGLKDLQSAVYAAVTEGLEEPDKDDLADAAILERKEHPKNRRSKKNASQIRLESGDYGWDYLIVNEATGEDILIQTDYDYPSVAMIFGWSGSDADIQGAQEYLDDHIGDTAEDPGYFEGEAD